MSRLLVNNPTGEQVIVDVDGTGEYYGDGVILWDERVRGDMGNIVLGKMVLLNGTLREENEVLESHANAIYSKTVPQEVPITAACEALINAGLYGAVDEYINTLSLVDKVWWGRTDVIHRQFPLVSQVQAQLGLTDQQIDQLFVAAEQIRKQRAGIT